MALPAKNPPVNAGGLKGVGLIRGLGRSPGGGHGNPLQDSCLENSTDRGAWPAIVHGVSKSQIQLKRLSTHKHLTLCDPLNCILPGFSDHEISQERILELLPFPSPGDLSNPGTGPASPALQADSLHTELSGKHLFLRGLL